MRNIDRYRMADLPEFPKFARVNESVRSALENYTDQHDPYSDFNYVNLVSWDIAGMAQISQLHGNVVLSYPDYLDGSGFYTFLGNNRVHDTTHQLLETSRREHGVKRLRLVPAIGAHLLKDCKEFISIEDHDNHDYVLSLPEVSKADGSSFRQLRREVKAFQHRHHKNIDFGAINITDHATKRAMHKVFHDRESKKPHNDHEPEEQAFERLFDRIPAERLISFGVRVNEVLSGFIIAEEVGNSWGIGHFWKADTQHKGIYRFLMQQTAVELSLLGMTHFNIEQDLGLPGLKQMKQSFNPILTLKKYSVERRSGS